VLKVFNHIDGRGVQVNGSDGYCFFVKNRHGAVVKGPSSYYKEGRDNSLEKEDRDTRRRTR
jgi:hypothetical protein